MWYFRSPHIVFGEDALSHLDQITGRRAFIVTDPVMQELGFVKLVQERLDVAGIKSAVFSQVEPESSLETVHCCAEAMLAYQPDWIVGLGGGSCMDTAKAAWFLYERPDLELEAMNPLDHFGLRAKARLVTIPTTAGSGSEVSQAAVITDKASRRKLELASFEIVADLTIVDPRFSTRMPGRLTADTGLDALTHVVEAYNNNWTNDFTDGLCLQATRMIFTYLPRAVEHGETDFEAREKMANAATIAGLAICNSNISLAHAMSHSAGAVFHLSHGRVTAFLLPYTIEFTANGGMGRYLDLARMIDLSVEDEEQAACSFASALRDLIQRVGGPVSFAGLGVSRGQFDMELEAMCDRAEIDLGMVMARRMPDRDELRKLYTYAYEGRVIDF